jgi:hypothetical protein
MHRWQIQPKLANPIPWVLLQLFDNVHSHIFYRWIDPTHFGNDRKDTRYKDLKLFPFLVHHYNFLIHMVCIPFVFLGLDSNRIRMAGTKLDLLRVERILSYNFGIPAVLRSIA